MKTFWILGDMRARFDIVALLATALLIGGCALPQTVERYVYERDGHEVVSALRYARKASNPIDDLRINVTDALPFQIRLPDGVWIRSQDLSRDILVQHGLLKESDKSEFVFWHLQVSALSYVAGRYESFVFRLSPDGRVIEVKLATCGYAFGDVLRDGDGARSFAFPMSVGDLVELFGRATTVERIGIVTGFSCL